MSDDEAARLAGYAHESEARFRAMANNAPVMLWMAGPDGDCEFFNSVWIAFSGRTMAQELGVGWAQGVHFEDFQNCMNIYLQAFVVRRSFRMEYRLRRADGQYRWILDTGIPRFEPDGRFAGFIGSCIDITEIREARDLLRRSNDELEARVHERTAALTASLKEKEVLLREVHHRVKNNLQLVSSLLNMQGRQIADPRFRAALDECQSRVQAIALIHERLYQSRDLANVPFADYVRSLAASVFHATGVSPTRIALDVEIDDITLPVDRAIPCGLILNELMTNALKHAFPDGREGRVGIAIKRLGDARLALIIADDGVGLPAELDIQNTHTLGLELVCTLSEQLEGMLHVDRQQGTSFRLEFESVT